MRVVKKREERRREIVEAALALFSARPYDQVTMQDLIEKVGIAKGTLYHYFKSKEELLEAVVEHIVGARMQKVRAAIDSCEEGAAQKMKRFAQGAQMDQPQLLEQLHAPGSELLHLRLIGSAIDQMAPLLATVIEQGCAEGLFDTRCPLESAEFILAGLHFLMDRGLGLGSVEARERRAGATAHLVEQQLGAPAGSLDFLAQVIE